MLRNTVIRVLTNKWIKRKRKWVIDLILVWLIFFRLGRQQLVSWRDPPFVTQRALQSLWCVNHHVDYFLKHKKKKGFLRRLMLHRGTKNYFHSDGLNIRRLYTNRKHRNKNNSKKKKLGHKILKQDKDTAFICEFEVPHPPQLPLRKEKERVRIPASFVNFN